MKRVKSSRVEMKNKFLELREKLIVEVSNLMVGIPAIEETKKDLEEVAEETISFLTKEKTTKTLINDKTLIVKAQVKLNDDEKKLALIKEKEKIENHINNQKQELENEILKVIRNNSKFILFSKSNEEMYKYYKLVLENPLPSKYAKIEIKILKKYISMNKYASDELKKYLGITIKSGNNDIAEKRKKIDEYLQKALEEKDLSFLEEARNLINELKDEKLRNEALSKIEEVKLQIAISFVEKAEESRLKEDVDAAKSVVNSLDFSLESAELSRRLDSIVISKVEEFKNLLRKVSNDSDAGNNIIKDEIIELRNLYQTLTKEEAEEYKNAMCIASEIYNNQIQDEFKNNINEETIKKHSLLSIFTELFSSSYLLKSDKLNNRKLTRQEKKLQKINEILDKENNEKKKEYIEKIKTRKEAKIEIIKDKMADSDIISDVELFMLRNKINKLKPKLYRKDITEKQEIKLQKSLNKFTNKLSKGLVKRIDKSMEFIKTDKQRVINILDQYIELLSVTNDFDNTYSKAIEFLENVESGLLTEAEINGYTSQFVLIKNYRSNNLLDDDGNLNLNSIYESDLNETDNIVKYYDEEYSNQANKLRYISK